MGYHPRHKLRDDIATAEAEASWKTYCETTCAKRFDLHGYQRMFPDIAAKYFRSTGLSAPEVAVAFGVSTRTAENWINGTVAPAGNKVALIALRDPEGFTKHFSEVAA